MDRARRSTRYVERLAARTAEAPTSLPRRKPSTREWEILELIAQDKDPQAIARELYISPTTVRNHVQRILEKLSVHSIPEAVAFHILKLDRKD